VALKRNILVGDKYKWQQFNEEVVTEILEKEEKLKILNNEVINYFKVVSPLSC